MERLKKFARNKKKLDRMVKQARLRRICCDPIYKFGVRVPRDSCEARFLEQKEGHTKWEDVEKVEIKQLFDYKTFKDLGLGAGTPENYKQIQCPFVYDIKHDGRYKARLVAGGHLTEPNKDQAYSGVVSLQSMRLAILAGELNGLKIMVGNIGNAYLEPYTKEKVCFTTGPEFGDLTGHTFVIVKA